MFFALQNTIPDTPKHYVWPPQTVCLTISNILFDNFNTPLSRSKAPYSALSSWLPDGYGKVRNTRVFCPSDFQNDFRGHSRDSKRLKIDYIFSCRTASVCLDATSSPHPYPFLIHININRRHVARECRQSVREMSSKQTWRQKSRKIFGGERKNAYLCTR